MDGVAMHRGPVRLSHGVDGEDVVLVTCSNDVLLISDPSSLVVKERVQNDDFVSCAHSPASSLIVAGDARNYVKSFWRRGGADGVLARLSLPPLCLVFSPCGTILAAAGDGDGVKLIDVQSSKVLRHLRPCSCVRGMAYDPRKIYLVILTAQGTLLVWNLKDGERCEMKTGAARKVAGKTVVRCDWSPDGRFFCIPNGTNGFSCYRRDTWQLIEKLQAPSIHTQPIVSLSISPNGIYLASGGEDHRICISHLPSSKPVGEIKLESSISDLEWHPTGHRLSVGTDAGSVRTLSWDDLCRDPSLPDPSEDVDPYHLSSDSEASISDDASDDDRSETSPRGWKRQRTESEHRRLLPSSVPERHGVVHPGCTEKSHDNKPFFLCWNSDGRIVVQSSERSHSIQIFGNDFKLPPFLDFDGYSMGSLGKEGVVFASPGREATGKGWKPSKLHHRSFDAWSHHAAWEVELVKEEMPICVAEGEGFCAVCTSSQLLRIFTAGGLAMHVFSTPGNVVCLVAKEHRLAMFYQTAGGEIEFQMYDVPKRQLMHQGRLQFSKLTWAGFDDAGVLHVMDDAMRLSRWIEGFGGQWMPVFYGKDHVSSTEALFVVEIVSDKVTAVRHGRQSQPQVQPPSVLEDFLLRPPSLEEGIEEQSFLPSLWMTSLGLDGDEDDDGRKEKVLLTMFNRAAKNGKEERCLELVRMMRSPLFVQGALKLANHCRLMILAEKISKVLEDRQGED